MFHQEDTPEPQQQHLRFTYSPLLWEVGGGGGAVSSGDPEFGGQQSGAEPACLFIEAFTALIYWTSFGPTTANHRLSGPEGHGQNVTVHQGQKMGLGQTRRQKPCFKRRQIHMYTRPTFTSAAADEDQAHRFCLQQNSGSVLRSAEQPQTTAKARQPVRLPKEGGKDQQQLGREDLLGEERNQKMEG